MDVEFRILPHGNSGIALRGRYELQLVDDSDKPPSNHGSGAILGRIAPSINAAYPAGEWQTLSVRLIGRQVTEIFNGIRVLDRPPSMDQPQSRWTPMNPSPVRSCCRAIAARWNFASWLSIR